MAPAKNMSNGFTTWIYQRIKIVSMINFTKTSSFFRSQSGRSKIIDGTYGRIISEQNSNNFSFVNYSQKSKTKHGLELKTEKHFTICLCIVFGGQDGFVDIKFSTKFKLSLHLYQR